MHRSATDSRLSNFLMQIAEGLEFETDEDNLEAWRQVEITHVGAVDGPTHACLFSNRSLPLTCHPCPHLLHRRFSSASFGEPTSARPFSWVLGPHASGTIRTAPTRWESGGTLELRTMCVSNLCVNYVQCTPPYDPPLHAGVDRRCAGAVVPGAAGRFSG